ncbi:hypothetical protein BpHYR1_031659 [Brachionus plicatilis]|uniref:Uncharacterized protein n=1 Tax=Brachionus plicatilis TaxID=10195 RepID=A0A3M7QFF4_BRAPC|nr:hypothetical protein BpHYR1_031659 [Brachionus plicatilis]
MRSASTVDDALWQLNHNALRINGLRVRFRIRKKGILKFRIKKIRSNKIVDIRFIFIASKDILITKKLHSRYKREHIKRKIFHLSPVLFNFYYHGNIFCFNRAKLIINSILKN